MRLTKDEARILSHALQSHKRMIVNDDYFKGLDVFTKLHDLQKRLKTYGETRRTNAENAKDDWKKLVLRFSNQVKIKM